jgi:hypothetical protein
MPRRANLEKSECMILKVRNDEALSPAQAAHQIDDKND